MRKSDFELAEIVCKAWNEKNVDFLEPYLSDEFIQAIHQTFHDREMIKNFLCSKRVQEFINSKDFRHDDLAEFARALVRKDKTLLI